MKSELYQWGDALPTLGAQRVSLRMLRDGDVPALHAIFSDVEVLRYWGSPGLADEEGARDLLQEIHDLFRARSLFQWGVVDAEDTVIGTCTLFRIDADHRRAEIGFALARDRWGFGYATEAVGRLVQFAFNDLDLHRLEADADPRNRASISLLEKLGFRREGLLRERYHVAGERQDSAYFGLLRREWRGTGP